MNLILLLCRTKLCWPGDVATVAVAVMIAAMMANPKVPMKKKGAIMDSCNLIMFFINAKYKLVGSTQKGFSTIFRG